MKDSSVPAPVMAGKVPSELYISEKWDKCLERTVVNVASGAVLGLLSGFVLARKSGLMEREGGERGTRMHGRSEDRLWSLIPCGMAASRPRETDIDRRG
ncbi:Protein of unknown function DUF543 [Nannochloropsis gaditana]|uniref:MICOS complex subunit MIC10 n=1 Tax=Nannochloropsis gaditana TaxID=72520 RepID=W7TW05_9STRA|nr:Protein of unknown function DUF543 [Nannochloropsis gaditana]